MIERPEDERTERAIELAREMTVEIPAAAKREEMRTAILAAAARRVPVRRSNVRRYAIVGAAIAAAAATIAIVIDRSGEPTAIAEIATITHRGTVHPQDGARFTSTTLPDEIVRLEDGRIAVEVEPLAAGERFRVVVGDGEVEVRGTAFEVIASSDHLVAVSVAHGRVEVRPVGGTITVLNAGESWHRTLTARVDPIPPPPPSPSPAPRPSPAPAHMTMNAQPKPAIAITRTPEAIALDEAWAAMRTSKFAAAAVAFARVVAIAPDGPLADDARFWTAVANSRAGDRDAAIVAFRDLVVRHPTSVHADEANVMLGWLLLETGVLDEARRRFVAGAVATPSEVHDSARAGLEALDKP